MSPLDNWFHFRKLLSGEKDLDYIPYIGLFLSDLTMIKDGGGTRVHFLPKIRFLFHGIQLHNGHIGWLKNERIYEILALVVAIQDANDFEDVISPDPEVQKVFHEELYRYDSVLCSIFSHHL